MKIGTTLQGRQEAATHAHVNLRQVPRLRPAKLSSSSSGLGKTRRTRRSRVTARGIEPLGALPENQAARAFSANPAEPFSAKEPRGDNLQLYLREIGQVQLLTPAEEIVLAKRIQKGDEQAREQMIKANLRLVVKIARDYEGLGLPLLDLINEGNIGLMKGVERFNPTKGAKLSTYASLWIKQSIRRALGNQSKTIRLPVHVVDKMAHIRLAERKLREALDREATDEELAAELGYNLRQVKFYREAGKTPISLDAPLSDGEEGKQVSEVVADPNAVVAYEQMVKEGDAELLQASMATLSERERTILTMRFGLGGDSPKTLEQVGEHYALTRERIRQIQEEALLRLRAEMKQRDVMPEEDMAEVS